MAPKEDAAAAMKRKAEEAAKGAPAAKDAKVTEEKIVEPDAPEDKRAAIKETVGFDPSSTTLNVIPTMGGRMLMTLTEGGMQYLLAGARANVGLKSGRYMFEVRMVESLASTAQPGAGRSATLVKHLVRVGFSLSASSLVLGGGGDIMEDGMCFDSEGFWSAPGQKKKELAGQKFGKDNVMAVMLNLDADSPNGNTITLFKDGASASKPMKIPESLIGKALFPHVAFRNASLQLNFGPEPLAALPFKCRTVQTAAAADVEVQASSTPKDGKFDVVFPVGIPDEGTFPWLDEFLNKNPQYTELSDRKIVEWAQKSGLWKPKGSSGSNDKPTFNFGIAALDDFSARKVIQIAAPLVPRHYVVMEVRGNLMKSVRKDTLKRFKSAHYRRTAKVVVGEPDKDYRKKVLDLALKAKQDKVNADWKAKKAERERKKQIAIKQKQLAVARKAADEAAAKKKAEAEERKKKLAEETAAKKKAAAEAKEAEAKKKAEEEAEKKKAEEAEAGEEKKEEGEDAAKAEEEKKKEEEAKAEEEKKKKEEEEQKEAEKKEKEAKDAALKEQKAEEDKKKKEEADKKKEEEEAKQKEEDEKLDAEMGTEPPAAELTEEEKKVLFPKRDVCDITASALASGLSQFASPSADEGFDKVDYVWDKEAAAKEYLRSWSADKKITTKIEDLQPSEWFQEKFADWQKSLQNWQLLQQEFKSDPVKMAQSTLRNEKFTAKQEGTDKKKEDKKDEEMKEGEEKKEGEEEEKKPEEDEDMGEAAAAIDVNGVKNIDDIGNGEPLCLHFAFEDWALVSLRVELFLLAAAFLHDTGDPERVGIHESHLSFYYNKYFKKSLNSKFYGAENFQALLTMVKDTVAFDAKHNTMMSQIADGADSSNDVFMKLTESVRRERQRKIDAGDETARLKFSVMHASAPAAKSSPDEKSLPAPKQPGAQQSAPKAGNVGKSWGKGDWGGKGGKWGGGKGGKWGW